MKICFTQPRVSYYNGGGERYTLDAIRAISKINQYEIYLITSKARQSETENYKIFKKEMSDKIEIIEISIPDKFDYIYQIEPGQMRYRWDIESINFNASIYNILRKKKIDILWCSYILDGIFVPESTKSIINLLGFPRKETYYLEGLLSRYDLIVSNSNNVILKWNKLLDKKIIKYKILPQGINFKQSRKKPKNDKIVILFAGRYIERKGILQLLSAFSHIQKEFKNVELRLFGEGPHLRQIKSFLRKNSLDEYVTVNGFVENIDIEMQNANFCVFPSWEGEGLMSTVLEAMYYNGLVITTSNNGNEEVMKHGESGFIVPPNNVEELTKEIRKVIIGLENFEEIRNKAKKSISQHFSWDAYCKKFAEIIESLNQK